MNGWHLTATEAGRVHQERAPELSREEQGWGVRQPSREAREGQRTWTQHRDLTRQELPLVMRSVCVLWASKKNEF